MIDIEYASGEIALPDENSEDLPKTAFEKSPGVPSCSYSLSKFSPGKHITEDLLVTTIKTVRLVIKWRRAGHRGAASPGRTASAIATRASRAPPFNSQGRQNDHTLLPGAYE